MTDEEMHIYLLKQYWAEKLKHQGMIIITTGNVEEEINQAFEYVKKESLKYLNNGRSYSTNKIRKGKN